MNINEAIIEIDGTHGDDKDRVASVLAAGLIADSISRLAKAQERQADIQEKQIEIASGMMSKLGSVMDQTVYLMNNEDDVEEWKRNTEDDDYEN